ncbi:MAG: MotA/TolQ/ExbB proton channel family protein [Gammaproteobacteria bacterium]|nr:MotA/TolQ/ExbB proton channel family protein [Gammaproteobacteria bacterium]
MTIAEIFDKGGIVVWVLLAYSFIAMVIVLERFVHYLIMGQPVKDFENLLLAAIKSDSLEKELGRMKGPEARLMQGIVRAKLKNTKDLQSVASRYGSAELQSMERGFRTLSILGHTAPLLGLLGTIMGMIKAFMVIELAGGQVDAQALAGGIWEAMLTTGVGLAVAIPILLLLHVLEGMADRRAHSMRCYSMLLLEHLPHDEIQREPDTVEASHHRKGVVHAV